MTDKEKRGLLRIARASMTAAIRGGPIPNARVPVSLPENDDAGVFVSLHRGRCLRGCMGRFRGTGSIGATVASVAVSAVMEDPRFISDRVTLEELDAINVEISVLSPRQRTDDPLSIQIGVHGIVITRGTASGCFLPQVAVQNNWSPEQFLRECCVHKAGLSPDAWRESDTSVELFASEVFSERELT